MMHATSFPENFAEIIAVSLSSLDSIHTVHIYLLYLKARLEFVPHFPSFLSSCVALF